MAFFIYLFKDCISKTNNEALHVAFLCSYANLLLWFSENITQIYPLAAVSLCETGTVWGNWTEPSMPDGVVSGCFGIILCVCSVVYKKHIEGLAKGKQNAEADWPNSVSIVFKHGHSIWRRWFFSWASYWSGRQHELHHLFIFSFALSSWNKPEVK